MKQIVIFKSEYCEACTLIDETISMLPPECNITIYDMDTDEFLANSLAVEYSPTVIIFKDGVEQERLVGNLTPSHILSIYESL